MTLFWPSSNLFLMEIRWFDDLAMKKASGNCDGLEKSKEMPKYLIWTVCGLGQKCFFFFVNLSLDLLTRTSINISIGFLTDIFLCRKFSGDCSILTLKFVVNFVAFICKLSSRNCNS